MKKPISLEKKCFPSNRHLYQTAKAQIMQKVAGRLVYVTAQQPVSLESALNKIETSSKFDELYNWTIRIQFYSCSWKN